MHLSGSLRTVGTQKSLTHDTMPDLITSYLPTEGYFFALQRLDVRTLLKIPSRYRYKDSAADEIRVRAVIDRR